MCNTKVRDTFSNATPPERNRSLKEAFDEAHEYLSVAANRLDVGPLTPDAFAHVPVSSGASTTSSGARGARAGRGARGRARPPGKAVGRGKRAATLQDGVDGLARVLESLASDNEQDDEESVADAPEPVRSEPAPRGRPRKDDSGGKRKKKAKGDDDDDDAGDTDKKRVNGAKRSGSNTSKRRKKDDDDDDDDGGGGDASALVDDARTEKRDAPDDATLPRKKLLARLVCAAASRRWLFLFFLFFMSRRVGCRVLTRTRSQ
jgi:hypothetical protein